MSADLCAWCNLPLPDFPSRDRIWDHIIPKVRGGPDADWNRQLLHSKCNGLSGKGAKLTDEAVVLAVLHGIILREPLRTSWPGCGQQQGFRKTPNPSRLPGGQRVSLAYIPGRPPVVLNLSGKRHRKLAA